MLLGAIIVTLLVTAELTGVRKELTIEKLRAIGQRAGLSGMALYVGIFVVAGQLQLPGLLVIAGAVLAFGDVTGAGVSLIGATASMMGVFLVGRFVGGKALTEVKHPWMRRLLAAVDRAPVRTVILIRLILATSTPASYALALSHIKARNFLIGSALGVVPWIAAIALFLEWFLKHVLTP